MRTGLSKRARQLEPRSSFPEPCFCGGVGHDEARPVMSSSYSRATRTRLEAFCAVSRARGAAGAMRDRTTLIDRPAEGSLVVEHAYFPPRAIKANEDAVRETFAPQPGDDPVTISRSRIGQRIGPAYIRSLLEEINRGTPSDVSLPALLAVLGWILANCVASVPEGEERTRHLAQIVQIAHVEAAQYAAGNDVLKPARDAYGEEVGGHG